MVKAIKNVNAGSRIKQGEKRIEDRAANIGASTGFETIGEKLSSFGGLLGLVKFFDLIKFKEVFDKFYLPPSRQPNLGHYKMICGLLMLLFIGFNRIWHFKYIRFDSMLCGILKVSKLPFVTTYWRYVNSIGINQGQSLIGIMSALRERTWHLCGISLKTIHIDFDTTVTTVFGEQEGARKGHNTKHRGKKGFRGVFGFIEETREYITGKLRTGETIGGVEFAKLLKTVRKYIPGCVQNIIIRGDGEFMSWDSVKMCIKEGLHYIFANKLCTPSFIEKNWYKVRKEDKTEYNECMYQPTGWDYPCRFVAMRIPLEEQGSQLSLLEEMKYKVRIFVTDLRKRPHKIIREYDKRADCENLIGEVQSEGINAIPSKMFSNNYAFFQIVMLSFNIWRSFKMLSGHASKEDVVKRDDKTPATDLRNLEIVTNTIRIARLKLLLIASKVISTGNTTKVKYSEHDSRVEGLFKFYRHMDMLRSQTRPWLDVSRWQCKHMRIFKAEATAM